MSDRFFTIEGIDGSGKTTISKYIGESLNARGIPATVVESYPRDPESMFLRDLWIQQKVPDTAVLSCILTLRRRQLEMVIIPALLCGHIVISDRWNDTTWVYQHMTLGIPEDVMKSMFDYHLNIPKIIEKLPPRDQRFLFNELKTYSTVWLDINEQRSQERVGYRDAPKDAFEKSPAEFFQQLALNFRRRFMERSPVADGPLYFVDGNRSLDEVKLSVDDIFKNISR